MNRSKEREELWNQFLFEAQREMKRYLVARKRITETLPECLHEWCAAKWGSTLCRACVGRRIRKEELELLDFLWQQEVQLHTGREKSSSREIVMDAMAIESYLSTDTPLCSSPEQKDLREKIYAQLLARVLELSQQELTEIQSEILSLKLKGLTYKEIAKVRGVNYTAIAHAIGGIVVHTKDGGITKHGGILKKLKRICSEDEMCVRLLKELHALRG